MKLIDLHVHSTASDGTLSPSELAVYAKQKGLSAIALTDHDTIDGVKECQTKGQEIGLEVIAGIEFSVDYYGKELHMLGYFMNTATMHPVLSHKLSQLVEAREHRNELMLQKLADCGYPLTKEDLEKACPKNAILTRAHIALAMVQKGYISDRNKAFTHYIGDGKPCFVPKNGFEAKDCIKLIHEAGGLAVLAHPMLYGYSKSEITQVIHGLQLEGLDGVECLYSTHTINDTQHLMQICSAHHLLPTGGSDFHGENKPNLDLGCGYGHLEIPYTLLEALKQKLALR